jgi:hypothetical protein
MNKNVSYLENVKNVILYIFLFEQYTYVHCSYGKRLMHIIFPFLLEKSDIIYLLPYYIYCIYSPNKANRKNKKKRNYTGESHAKFANIQ